LAVKYGGKSMDVESVAGSRIGSSGGMALQGRKMGMKKR